MLSLAESRAMTTLNFLSPEETLCIQRPERVSAGEIHVWPVHMTGSEESRLRYASLLNEEELARAGRYYFERDRIGFVFSRGQMRHLLSLYCGVDGASLRFVAGTYGKLDFAPDHGFANAISFNLTHSGGRAVLVVSDGRALGVDLECHDRKTDVVPLADRYFFASELQTILAAPPARHRELFFRFWTAKEAVIKAQGTGLGVPLNSFRVEVLPAPAVSAVETFDTAHVDEGWFLRELICEPGWSAAVVAKGEWRVSVRGRD
jgi:4'-phosphopantetheinyl transferase